MCKRFPFDDSSIDYIFHEHLIEHLDYHQGQFMLRECFRVIKPGGRLRIAAPDFAYFVGLYQDDITPEQQFFLDEYIRFNSTLWSADLMHVNGNKAVFVVNHCFSAQWGHRFMYDFSTLSDAMRSVGFVDITQQKPRESSDPNLRGLECRKDIVGILDALIAEGRKPAAT